jgi:hypothetical protein
MSEKNMAEGIATHERVSPILGKGVGRTGRRVIGVTGVPGVWLNQVGRFLEGQGALILWPDQAVHSLELDKYKHNAENPEVIRMHDAILASCGSTRYSCRYTRSFPLFYDPPFPGPQDFVAQFPEDKVVIVVDNALCLLWDLWSSVCTDLVLVDASLDSTTYFLKRWVDGNMNDDECRLVFEGYQSAIQHTLSNFKNVYRVDNEEIKNGFVARTVLNSII